MDHVFDSSEAVKSLFRSTADPLIHSRTSAGLAALRNDVRLDAKTTRTSPTAPTSSASKQSLDLSPEQLLAEIKRGIVCRRKELIPSDKQVNPF